MFKSLITTGVRMILRTISITKLKLKIVTRKAVTFPYHSISVGIKNTTQPSKNTPVFAIGLKIAEKAEANVLFLFPKSL